MAALKNRYIPQKVLLLTGFCVLFTVISGMGQVFALETAAPREDLWVCPGAEISMFSFSGVAFGGGLTIGYGNGASIGVKAAYFLDAVGNITTLELNFLFRLYILGVNSCSGPYIQISGGPTYFSKDNSLSLPSEFGAISAGLSFGWRFLLGRFLFIEPVVRGGYPYLVGGGLFAGFHY